MLNPLEAQALKKDSEQSALIRAIIARNERQIDDLQHWADRGYDLEYVQEIIGLYENKLNRLKKCSSVAEARQLQEDLNQKIKELGLPKSDLDSKNI